MNSVFYPRLLWITGASGFLAKHLNDAVKQLWPEARILLFSRRSGYMQLDYFSQEAVDLALKQNPPDLILHTAGALKAESLQGYLDANVMPANALLKGVLALCPATRMILIGSAAEYGALQQLPLKEDLAGSPMNFYGVSKLAQTAIAQSWFHLGLHVQVARIFNLLGPGLSTDLSMGSFASQIRQIHQGKQEPVLQTGNLNSRRDFIDVRDAARGILLLAAKGNAGSITNVCSGGSQRIGDLLHRLVEFSQQKISIHESRVRVKSLDIKDSYGCNQKLKALGFEPLIPVEESLRDMLIQSE